MNEIKIYKRGFTLIELLVVISIIGLLSSVVLSSTIVAREKARMASAFDSEARLHHVAGDIVVGQWEFDDCSGSSVRDSSGFGRDGTLISSPSWSTDTPTGKGCSLLLSGGTQYVYLGNDPVFDLTSEFTIAAWIKPNPLSATSSQTIMGKTHTSSYYFGFQNNRFRFWTNNSLYNPTRVYNLSDDRWHHVVASYENGFKTIYADGKLIGKEVGVAPIADTSNLRIGGSSAAPNPFVGHIDGVRLYGKGLTAGEVRHIYAME